MNDSELAELARLKEEQARLETELRLLAQQLTSLELRVTQTARQTPNPTWLAIQPVSPATESSATAPIEKGTSANAAPPIITRPASIFSSAKFEEPVSQLPAADFTAQGTPPLQPPPLSVPTSPIPAQPTTRQGHSFEMRLGTFWLVRIGVVMVLTGLVFFGNLAYHNYISRLGPAGKASLLYIASGLLLGSGWWWQRRAVKETLRNYAQVLFAGGLAALYFTTYAAHHLETLRIIQSPLLDGILLLVCAGFMIWAAERKKSEVLALFAVGLAYYTSIITRVGAFTLWSNLILSVTAVCFLVRNRWAALSFGSLVATYVAYTFWRFFDGNNWHWASPSEGLWSGACFLMLYWLVFTSAVFLSRDRKFAGQNRASFLTLNNAAFFSLFLLTMLQVQHGGFWKFSLIYGAILIGLAVLAGRLLADEPLSSGAYLTQGLLLVTVGFISKFAGLQLALILGTESVLLLVMGQQRKNLVLLSGAYIAALLAVGWGMDGLKQFDTPGLWLGMGLGILMMANAWLTHRTLLSATEPQKAESEFVLRPQPSYFTVLALVIWLVATWDNCSKNVFPLVLAAEALVLSFSIYFLRIPEVPVLSQGLMLLAYGAWFSNWSEQPTAPAWWIPCCLISSSLVLSHWWPRQTVVQPKAQNRTIWPALYALGINLVLYLWLSPKAIAPSWLVTTSLLALGLTLYGLATRAWFIAAFAQLFIAVSVAQFGLQLWQAKPAMGFPIAPIAALSLLSFGTVWWFQTRPETDSRVRDPLLTIALIYRWVALVLAITWICEYVPARERIWVFALLGLLVFLLAGLKKNQEALLYGSVFTVTALILFWLPLLEAPTVYFPNLVAIIVLLTQRQIARRLPERYPIDSGIHNAVILTGGLSLWLFVSRWVLEMASGFYLTASWSLLALALFTAGLLLRERMYRWVGLGVLACALGRVVLFDVWKLETVYRILSFMALGIVLLVLGFIYSKYQEKIREWL